MQDQIMQFRQLLTEHGLSVDDFALNVDGDAFRGIMSGGEAELAVVCRSSQVSRVYKADGTASWLSVFTDDLADQVFTSGH